MTPTTPFRNQETPVATAPVQEKQNIKKNTYQSITVEYDEDDEPVPISNSLVDKRKNLLVALVTGFACLACAAAVLLPSPRENRLKQSSVVHSSNESTFPSFGIINGDDADIGQYPWFAFPLTNGRTRITCGGMLVAPEYVLTAAHCDTTRVALRTNSYQIGKLCDRNNNCGQTSETIGVERLIPHPDYDDVTLDYDFMLAKLDRKATTKPVPVEQDTAARFDKLWSIGFGDTDPRDDGNDRTRDDVNYPSRLQDVQVSYVDRSTCANTWRLTDNMMCADEPDAGSCRGDSGGPLYDKEKNVVVGVVSYGPAPRGGQGCAVDNEPVVYAKIAAQWDWMKAEICVGHSDPKPEFCDGTTSCTNVPNWRSRIGFTCEAIENVDLPGCPKYGTSIFFNGDQGSAQTACCYCANGA